RQPPKIGAKKPFKPYRAAIGEALNRNASTADNHLTGFPRFKMQVYVYVSATSAGLRIGFMDAMAVLRDVSDAYRGLKTLEIEASIVVESGDEHSSQRSEQRVRFFYAAPERVRYERCGKKGMVQVADGEKLHTTFPDHVGGGTRVSSVPFSGVKRLPGLF